MNNQFATQFLREEVNQFDSLRSVLYQLGASEDTIEMLVKAVVKGYLQPSKAIEIVKNTVMKEDGAAAAPAGGSTTGGGVTNGATFTPGNGEQYAAGTRKRKYQEDAPMLAHGKANITTYTKDGFTKAPTAQEAGKKMQSIDVKDLWEEEPLSESHRYSQFKKETATRSKFDQMHEAAKMIQNKLYEIERLLEFTSQMKSELSEGEQTLEYKNNTKKVFERIHTKVVEVYTKVKSLK